MKLLFDENLSRRLVARLADLFPASSHVVLEGLLQNPDIVVWEYAKTREYAIVTADADFYELATTFGPPPKVIWLRGCDSDRRIPPERRSRRAGAYAIGRFGECNPEWYVFSGGGAHAERYSDTPNLMRGLVSMAGGDSVSETSCSCLELL